MDDYDWGWLDRDHVLLLASFKILKDFVEKEDPNVGLRTAEDYGSGDEWHDEVISNQLVREREIRALYNWWCNERPAEWSALDKRHAHWQKEEALSSKDDEMLLRLVKIRLALWT